MKEKVNISIYIDKGLISDSQKKLKELDLEMDLLIEIFLDNFLCEEKAHIDETYIENYILEEKNKSKDELIHLLKESEESCAEITFSTEDALMFLGVL